MTISAAKTFQSRLYYYGAQYYDPKSSVFLGVDPMSDKNPNESPFIYYKNNPIILVDPDGRNADNFTVDESGVVTKIEKTDQPHRLFFENKSGKRTEITFNDPENDSKQLETYKEGEQAVTFVPDKDVNGIMKESV